MHLLLPHLLRHPSSVTFTVFPPQGLGAVAASITLGLHGVGIATLRAAADAEAPTALSGISTPPFPPRPPCVRATPILDSALCW